MLVFNNTRVIPARLFGRKASGGKIEVLVERMLDDKRILGTYSRLKAPKPGAELLLGDDEYQATMTARHDALFSGSSTMSARCWIFSMPSATCLCRRTLSARMKRPIVSSTRPSTARSPAR